MSERISPLYARHSSHLVGLIPALLALVAACSPQDRNAADDASQAANTDRITSIEEEIGHFRQRLAAPVDKPHAQQQSAFSVMLWDGSRMTFVWVPPTTSAEWQTRSGGRDYFLMGDGRTDYSPYRFVRLDYGYFVARTEITRDQWYSLMGSKPWEARAGEPEHGGNLPVNSVSWSHAAQYVTKFNAAHPHSQLESFRLPVTLDDYVYRMPTEAEWEYAARAGMLEPGEQYLAQSAWYGHVSKTSQPVAGKRSNPWSIHDMLGNVFELTTDCWPTVDDIKFGDPAAIRTNPVGTPDGVNSRGGAWYSTSHVESFGWRSDCNSTGYRGDHVGMRLVLAPRLSLLEQAPQERPKPESVLLKDADQPLALLEKRHCDGSFRITDATVTQEYNDRIVLYACYAYRGDKRLSLSAITYADGANTGKWGYSPGHAEPGTGCAQLEVSKNSLFAYDSDALLISSGHNRCEHLFYFEKHWTDGTDERQ